MKSGPGHPQADPRILMALWLYATVEGIVSAQELMRLCEQHGAYQRLCGRVGMNHKTLSDPASARTACGCGLLRARLRSAATRGLTSAISSSASGWSGCAPNGPPSAPRATGGWRPASQPSRDAPAGAYGRRPGHHLANGGFAKLDDIETLARAGELTFVPVPQPRHKSRDSHQPRPDDPPVVAAWQWGMAAGEAKVVYRQRVVTAELVNAQARN